TEPLSSDWMPVQVFCEKCKCDTTVVDGWDGEWGISYRCSSCGHQGNPDLRTTDCAKLPWRIDWPMRWSREGVDFEPAGKDHHSEGGSFDTAKKIVKEVYGAEPPVTFQYDFVRIKGRGGKISSSSGEVVSLVDVLEVYTPEVTRFIFAGTRPNTEFAISFDLDVLKIYEDYEKCERLYFTEAESEKARKKKEKSDRIYELSQVDQVPSVMPYQIPIRHLCNLLQVHDGNVDAVIDSLGDVSPDQSERFRMKAACAWNWIRQFAPEDFRFAVKTGSEQPVDVSPEEKTALQGMLSLVRGMDSMDEKAVAEAIYAVARESGIEPADLFTVTYRALIGKEKGPRLASFIKTLGRKKCEAILAAYADKV
ncbi:MAG: lysine--tRNA ligase, partial [Spirochaetales bacterium]|nr:lysine--tRNA ligase [Spirochaetales bacterium]